MPDVNKLESKDNVILKKYSEFDYLIDSTPLCSASNYSFGPYFNFADYKYHNLV